ncbi:MAG: tRNA (adenosine(37)-N6)-dimethylallyltransferase MiaA [Candidatus Eiseniibacteriota bacterium]
MKPPLLPSLIGATASAKTALAVAAAKLVRAEIVSADSRQVYRRLEAGTAKPTAAERAAVPHHLIDVADPEETFTAARFGREAQTAAAAVRARGRIPLLVGGSGLYLRAAERGLFEGPAADVELRERLRQEAETHGDEALHARLAEADPETAARLHAADRVRVIRALEVLALTGEPLAEHHRRHRAAPSPFRCLRFGIEWEKEALARRIESRVDAMLGAGWIEEVERLVREGLVEDAPAWKALGYREVRDGITVSAAREDIRRRIVTATRQFAKRQRTWFRAVEGVIWFRVAKEADLEGIAATIAERIGEEAG